MAQETTLQICLLPSSTTNNTSSNPLTLSSESDRLTSSVVNITSSERVGAKKLGMVSRSQMCSNIKFQIRSTDEQVNSFFCFVFFYTSSPKHHQFKNLVFSLCIRKLYKRMWRISKLHVSEDKQRSCTEDQHWSKMIQTLNHAISYSKSGHAGDVPLRWLCYTPASLWHCP